MERWSDATNWTSAAEASSAAEAADAEAEAAAEAGVAAAVAQFFRSNSQLRCCCFLVCVFVTLAVTFDVFHFVLLNATWKDGSRQRWRWKDGNGRNWMEGSR